MNIILGSSSQYRAKLIRQLGFEPVQIAPEIDESPLIGELTEHLVKRLAAAKAESVCLKLHELTLNSRTSLIICSDQAAEFNRQIIGKPLNEAKAVEQLLSMSGQSVNFYTSLNVFCTETKRSYEATDLTQVTFRDLSSSEVSNYVAREQPLDCAGSFKCEGLGISLFESIKSEDPSALIGLPLISLNRGLLNFGVNALCSKANP